MQDKEKIIINYHIQDDPLSEENLDKTLNYLHEFRLLLPEKTIWLYTGYEISIVANNKIYLSILGEKDPNIENYEKRHKIISMCDVVVDGRYIDSQRNISAKWKGSDNQLVIDIKKSLQQNKVILYCD